MKKVGASPGRIHAHNTLCFDDRVFNFSHLGGTLVVTEYYLEGDVTRKGTNTGINCRTSDKGICSCCILGDSFLVTGGNDGSTDLFTALVTIEPKALGRKTVHVKELRLVGGEACRPRPFLAEVSEDRVWASFSNSNEVWFGKYADDELVMTRSATCLPTVYGFDASPIRLPDGTFLVAGTFPLSNDITLVSVDDDITFKKIGEMPGVERYKVSLVLIRKRFVAGFGGWNGRRNLDELWVFDLQSRNSSLVEKKGEWHPATCWPYMQVSNEYLYILGGDATNTMHSISLSDLSSLILDEKVQKDFQAVLDSSTEENCVFTPLPEGRRPSKPDSSSGSGCSSRASVTSDSGERTEGDPPSEPDHLPGPGEEAEAADQSEPSDFAALVAEQASEEPEAETKRLN